MMLLLLILLVLSMMGNVTGYPAFFVDECERELKEGVPIMGNKVVTGVDDELILQISKQGEDSFYIPNESVELNVVGSVSFNHIIVISGAKFDSDDSCDSTRTLERMRTIQMPSAGEVSITLGWASSPDRIVRITTLILLPLGN